MQNWIDSNDVEVIALDGILGLARCAAAILQNINNTQAVLENEIREMRNENSEERAELRNEIPGDRGDNNECAET